MAFALGLEANSISHARVDRGSLSLGLFHSGLNVCDIDSNRSSA